MLKRENYGAAARLIAKAKRILVSGHLSPDGDSVGSMIALVRLLRARGKEAVATADPNALGKPGFLEGAEEQYEALRAQERRRLHMRIK